MALSDSIKVRLREGQALVYAAQAEQRGVGIAAFIRDRLVQDDMATRGLVEKFVGSRGTVMFNGWSGAMSPAKRMQHHDMVGCLTVTRIQNWRRIAANEFAFDILFTADDSGESYLWQNKVHKEPDGTWLIA
jgi:hypothetical protein